MGASPPRSGRRPDFWPSGHPAARPVRLASTVLNRMPQPTRILRPQELHDALLRQDAWKAKVLFSRMRQSGSFRRKANLVGRKPRKNKRGTQEETQEIETEGEITWRSTSAMVRRIT